MVSLLMLWSEKAVFDNRKAIRGGIPIVFRKSLISQHNSSGFIDILWLLQLLYMYAFQVSNLL